MLQPRLYTPCKQPVFNSGLNHIRAINSLILVAQATLNIQTTMSCSLSVYRPSGELVVQWRDLFTTQTFEDLNFMIVAPLFRLLRDGRSIQLKGRIFDSENQEVDLQVVIFGAFDVKGYFSNWQLPVDVHMPELSGRIQINGNVLLGDVCEQLIERLFGDNTADAKLKSRLSHFLRTLGEYHEGSSVYDMEIFPFVNVDHPDGPQAISSCKSVKTSHSGTSIH